MGEPMKFRTGVDFGVLDARLLVRLDAYNGHRSDKVFLCELQRLVPALASSLCLAGDSTRVVSKCYISGMMPQSSHTYWFLA